LSVGDEEVERSKDLDGAEKSGLIGLNRRQVARKRIEAARA
jgi:large subunit ribosomal protein L17e